MGATSRSSAASLPRSSAASSPVTSQPANTQRSVSMANASRLLVASSSRHTVEIEEVEDEDSHSRNVSPSNASQLIESLDGSDDDGVEVVGRKRVRSSSVANIDDDSSEEVEETDKAEHGMTDSWIY